MKTLFPFAGFLTSLSAMAAEPPQVPENKDTGQDSFYFSAKTSNECVLLPNKNCDGKVQQLRFETPSGYFFSIEKINDQAGLVPFDKTYVAKPIGNIHGRIAWEEKITGTVARFGKAFHPTEQSTLNIEAYIGNISGSARLNGVLEGTAYPLSVTIPDFSYQVGQHNINYAGKPFSTQGGHKVFSSYDHSYFGQTYYGGFKESFGTSFGPYKNAHLLMSQFGQAGLDRIGYGAGLGLAYTSEQDIKIGQRSSNICKSGDFRSSARFAFVISACADKTQRDILYDKLLEKAARPATRANGYISEAQAAINKVEDRTGYGYTLPTYTSKDVLRELGIESPYDHIATSFVIAAALNLDGFTLTLSRTQPLKTSRDGPARTTLTLGKEF